MGKREHGLARRIAAGHVVDALAHDDLDTTALNLEAVSAFEWLCALKVVREERDRMAQRLEGEVAQQIVLDVRDWSAR